MKSLGSIIVDSTAIFPERDYFYRCTVRPYDEHAEIIIDMYERMFDFAKNMNNEKVKPETLREQQKYFKTATRIAENNAFWATQRKIYLKKHEIKPITCVEELIDNIPIDKRQEILVNNLKTWPKEFIEFSNLRKNTIDAIHNSKLNEEPLISPRYHHFLLNGNMNDFI